jgi:hypothetical protein
MEGVDLDLKQATVVYPAIYDTAFVESFYTEQKLFDWLDLGTEIDIQACKDAWISMGCFEHVILIDKYLKQKYEH